MLILLLPILLAVNSEQRESQNFSEKQKPRKQIVDVRSQWVWNSYTMNVKFLSLRCKRASKVKRIQQYNCYQFARRWHICFHFTLYIFIIFTCYFYHHLMTTIRFCFLNRHPNDQRVHLFFEPFFSRLFTSVLFKWCVSLWITNNKTHRNYFKFFFFFVFYRINFLFRYLNFLN